jgi:hypothetical protein
VAASYKNFAIATVATAPSPATSGTSLVVTASEGARFGGTPFMASIGPPDATHTKDNAERVRVSAISTDTFTIVRAQEGSTARTVIVGDVIYSGPGWGVNLGADLADGEYAPEAVEPGVAGATLAFGDVVYKAAADSRYELTDADAESTSGPVKIGMVVIAAAADGDYTLILKRGRIRANSKFPTFTISAPAYLSTTPGEVTVTQPSGTDDCIRIVGRGHAADELDFNPSEDWMVHV